ncbi:MAG: prefoldin subunit alpha [Thermoplasmata archaeon]|jgi:prefoldin alpha subunit
MSAGSPEVVTEEQVQEELMRLEAYRNQLSALLQQHQMLGASRIEHDRARETLETLDRLSADSEIVIPLGGDAYIRGSAARGSQVLLGIGSGVVVEMDRPKVVEILAQRLTRIDSAAQEMEGQVRTLEERVEMITQRLDSLSRAPSPAGGAGASDVGGA